MPVKPSSGRATFGLLPEPERSTASFITSGVINGLILVLIVLFLPKGLWDPQRFRQWFRRGTR